jgi:hypothetical protein
MRSHLISANRLAITPGAPWQIRLAAQLHGMLTDNTPTGWVPLAYATQALGVSGGGWWDPGLWGARTLPGL